MRKAVLLGVVFLVLAAKTDTHAQLSQDSVDLGGVSLILGMAQSDVLQRLGEHFDLRELSGVGSWMVVEKGKPKNAYGSLTFKNGALRDVIKYWTVDEPDSEAAFANALYGAVSNFESEGRTACTIHTGDLHNPTHEVRSVYVACGRKTIEVDLIRGTQDGESASVIETLEGPL